MKKNLILTLALGLFLISCQKSDMLVDAKSSESLTRLSPSAATCTPYSIFNPHGPTGPSVLYTYIDCNGVFQEGVVDPRQTVYIVAQQGTVKCPGGVVTENPPNQGGDPPHLTP